MVTFFLMSCCVCVYVHACMFVFSPVGTVPCGEERGLEVSAGVLHLEQHLRGEEKSPEEENVRYPQSSKCPLFFRFHIIYVCLYI